MPIPFENILFLYGRHVGQVRRYTESAEISMVLVERDVIRDRLRAGAVLDERQRAALLEADARLLTAAPLLSRRFEFDAEAAIREAIGEGVPEAVAQEPVAG